MSVVLLIIFYSELWLQKMSDYLPGIVRNLALDDISGDEEDSEADDLEENGTVDEVSQFPITADEVEKNYNLMGQLSQPCTPIFSLEDLRTRFPLAFSPQSERALASVLSDLSLPFHITPLQVFKVHLSNG